jgi:hypothetical protein
VVLYELVTGHRPYHLLSAALHEIARVISEEEPTRPSLVVTTTEERVTPEAVSEVREGDVQRLRKRLEGDVDCILLAALRKEPERRYSSVEALSDDVRRHLEKRPVSAHADSIPYRVSRMIRRHPGGTVAVLLLASSMLAGILTTLWQLRVAMDASRQRLSAQTMVAPQMALFLYGGVAVAVTVLYFARASARRVAGAAVGGVVFGAAWWVRFKVGYAMGWWKSAFEDTPDPLELFSEPLLTAVALLGLVVMLVAWRTTRRFGSGGNALLLLAVAVWAALRDRVWWDRLLHILVAAPGIMPIAADIALLVSGLWMGYGVMRLIAGAATSDPLVPRYFRA